MTSTTDAVRSPRAEDLISSRVSRSGYLFAAALSVSPVLACTAILAGNNLFLWGLAVITAALLPCGILQERRYFLDLHPVAFLVGGAVFYLGIPMIYWHFAGTFSLCTEFYGSTYSTGVKAIVAKTGLVTVAGLSLMWIGFHCRAGTRFVRHLPDFSLVKSRTVAEIGLLTLSMGVLSYAIKLETAGGILTFLKQEWASRFGITSAAYVYASFFCLLLDAGAILLFAVFYRRHRLISVAVLALAVLITNFVGGSRIDVMRLVLVALGLQLNLRNPTFFRKRFLTLLGFVGAFVYVVVWGGMRHRVFEPSTIPWHSHQYIVDKLDFPMLFDNLLMVIRDVPARIPFQVGWTYVRLLFFFIPRSIWPQKPPDLGTWITQNIRSDPSSLTSAAPTAFGEMYLNFGVLGVLGGAWVLGVVARAFSLYHRRAVKTKNPAGIALATLLGFLLFEQWRGGAAYNILNYGLLTMPFWLASVFGKTHQ